MAPNNEKLRLSIYLYPETYEKVKELYKKDGCIFHSQFVEKALRFYIGYLTAKWGFIDTKGNIVIECQLCSSTRRLY